jgi:hypothetical protein
VVDDLCFTIIDNDFLHVMHSGFAGRDGVDKLMTNKATPIPDCIHIPQLIKGITAQGRTNLHCHGMSVIAVCLCLETTVPKQR